MIYSLHIDNKNDSSIALTDTGHSITTSTLSQKQNIKIKIRNFAQIDCTVNLSMRALCAIAAKSRIAILIYRYVAYAIQVHDNNK